MLDVKDVRHKIQRDVNNPLTQALVIMLLAWFVLRMIPPDVDAEPVSKPLRCKTQRVYKTEQTQTTSKP